MAGSEILLHRTCFDCDFSAQVIAHARVPIIKFVEKKSNISFDIR